MAEILRLDHIFGPAVWTASGVLLFFLVEYIIPFRPLTRSKFRRWRINFSLLLCNLVLVDLCFVHFLRQIHLFSGDYKLDLFNQFQVGSVWRIILTVLIADFVTYWWHRINHEIPFLWRFHRVHHTDRDIDVSTAARFHFGEMTISAVLIYSLMLTLGATIVEARIFQIVLALFSQFNHSNIIIWKPIDRILWWIIVPPSMHKIHHSDIQKFTDSNYGTILSLWDRVLGTLKKDLKDEELVYGLKEYVDEKSLSLNRLLVLPFKKK